LKDGRATHIRRHRQDRLQSGLALVLVLWMLTLLSLIAAGFLTSSRSEMLAVRARVDAARVEALADGAVHWAIERLLVQMSLAETGGQSVALLAIDGRPQTVSLAGGEVEVRVQDMGGLVDLNAAAPPLLEGILTVVGVEPETASLLTDRILDFRDTDDRPRPNGAEDADYLAAGLPYGAKDAPFDRVDELRQIPGLSAEITERLAPHVTTLSGARGIDPASAPPMVLAAVPGLARPQIALILEARRSNPNGLDIVDRTNAALVASSRSSFRITAIAKGRDGGRFVREAVIQLRAGDERVRVRRWQQGRGNQARR